MKSMDEGLEIETEDKKDFTIDDLAVLKEDLLSLEKAVDAIGLKNTKDQEGATFEGSYIFELLEQANVNSAVISLLVHFHSFICLHCR